MVGCAPTVIPASFLIEFIGIRENMAEKFPDFGQAFLLEYDIELRSIYYDVRAELHNPALPELHNTDGEPLQLTGLHYTLKCAPREALDALATLAMFDANEVMSEGTFDKRGELVSIEFPWLKKGNKQHAAWDNTVMGHITIDGEKLIIDVNSQQRADAVKRKITRRLGKRAVFRNSVHQSTEKMLEEMRNDSAMLAGRDNRESEELMKLPEIQGKIRETASVHWKTWLDTPLPALKGQTPREAARIGSGQERLEALLLDFESREGLPQPFAADVEALRRSLGLS
jgi:hypothetical protein